MTTEWEKSSRNSRIDLLLSFVNFIYFKLIIISNEELSQKLNTTQFTKFSTKRIQKVPSQCLIYFYQIYLSLNG